MLTGGHPAPASKFSYTSPTIRTPSTSNVHILKEVEGKQEKDAVFATKKCQNQKDLHMPARMRKKSIQFVKNVNCPFVSTVFKKIIKILHKIYLVSCIANIE